MLTFAWPWGLLALAAVPFIVLWYRRQVRARAARRAELAALGLAGPAAGSGWKRTLPPALLLSAVVLLLAALARPEIGVPLPRREGTVMLAFDVSWSMTATDLTPTRMDAAKAAARTVVERQPPTVRVGVVAFGSSGLVTQQPTADRASVLAAIDRLQPGGGTALGSGLQTSLSVITGQTVLVDAAGARAARSSRRARTSATTAPRPSCCSPTGRTPRSRTRSPSRSWRRAQACGSTRSGSGHLGAP